MYQWLMEQHTMNLNATITNQEAKQVVRTDAANGGGATGAPPSGIKQAVNRTNRSARSTRTVKPTLVYVGRIYLVMRIDLSVAHRRTSFLESIAVTSSVVLDGHDNDFVVIPSGKELFVAMDLNNRQIFDERYAALQQLFGSEFAEKSSSFTVADISTPTKVRGAANAEAIYASRPLAFGTFRAVARYIQLLDTTILSRYKDGEKFARSAASLVETATFGLLVCGFQASQYPFPVHIVPFVDLPDDAS